MNEITPTAALNNVAAVVDQALLNGPDRRVIAQSIQVLLTLVESQSPKAENVVPIG